MFGASAAILTHAPRLGVSHSDSNFRRLLALSGSYAVRSFAVSRRAREIGIRVALGSSRSRVVLACLVPVLRVLKVDPIAALRAESAAQHVCDLLAESTPPPEATPASSGVVTANVTSG